MKKYLLGILTLICCMSACKSKQSIAVSTEKPTSSNEQIAPVLEAQPHFVTANATKLDMDIVLKNKGLKSSGACKIYRDSVIQLSIQPFMGIELFRLELTPEAVYLFDKTSNKYYHLVYKELTEITGIPLTFYDFQALISNQFFTLGSITDENFDKIKTSQKSNNQIFTYKTAGAVQQTITDGKNIKKVEIAGTNDDFLFTMDYADFKKTDNVLAPQTLKLRFESKQNNISLSFKISRIEFNKEMRVILTNPLRYQKGDLNRIFDGLPF